MRISSDVLTDIVRACRLAYPHEACGVLVGPRNDSTVTHMHQVDNVAEHPRYRYSMGELAQLYLWNMIDQAGDRVHAIWHSHTVDGAELSPEDLRHALDPEIAHLVIALPRADGVPQIRLWRVTEGQGIEQDYTVTT